MFDVGFFEILILGVVALLVVGPERLPKLAHTAGKWMGKGRSMIGSVKAEIEKEIKAEELKEILEKQKQALNPLEEVIEETSSAVWDLKNETDKAVNEGQRQHGSEDESYTQFGDNAEAASGETHDKSERSDT
ncbi:MAG: Sec-independent protein translocase protein TatB [Sedimenticola sp.]